MPDYKKTPEGKIVAQKYADILNGTRQEPSYNHPRMTLSNRAKIFSPFAALRGYEEEIAAEGEDHRRIAKVVLSEEDKGILSDKLLQVRKGMEVTVRFFEADDEPTTIVTPADPTRQASQIGNYRTVTGTVDRIDPVYRKLEINAGYKNVLGKELPMTILFDDILDLSGNDIVDIDEFLGIEPD